MDKPRNHTLILFIALCLTVLLSATSFAGPFKAAGGGSATPSVYEVTINKIELRRPDGSYYTYLGTPVTVDIGSASVAPGGTGGYASGATPPSGSYTGMRVTIARTFSMTGSASGVGPGLPSTVCRTGGSGTGSLNPGGGVTYQISNATSAAGTPSKQTVAIPTSSDSSIENAMNGAGLNLINANEMQFTVPVAINVSAADTFMPLEIDFDVSNKMEFLTTGGGICYVIPLPPTVTVTNAGATRTFESGI